MNIFVYFVNEKDNDIKYVEIFKGLLRQCATVHGISVIKEINILRNYFDYNFKKAVDFEDQWCYFMRQMEYTAEHAQPME